MEVGISVCGTPSSPQALTSQSLCPRAPLQAAKGSLHPPFQELPCQVLWPQLGSRGYSPTPAHPEPPQNNQGQPCFCIPAGGTKLGPKKPPGFESWPLQATSSHLLLRTASSTSPAQSPSSPYLPGATAPPERSTEPAVPLHFPKCPRALGGRRGWGAELPAWSGCLLQTLRRNARHWPPPRPARTKGRVGVDSGKEPSATARVPPPGP